MITSIIVKTKQPGKREDHTRYHALKVAFVGHGDKVQLVGMQEEKGHEIEIWLSGRSINEAKFMYGCR